jgi:hypothetical protein
VLSLEPPFSRPVNPTMEPLGESKDSGNRVENETLVRGITGSTALVSGASLHDFRRESSDKMDRQFRFPHGFRDRSGPQAARCNLARKRWLEANDVHTQFLDAGIGCCWFAVKGDQEPVSGETEDEAIARVARINGLDLWDARMNPTARAVTR